MAHYEAYERRSTVKAWRKRRALLASGNDAAARLRSEIKRSGEARCAKCRNLVLASAVDVDHIVPLAHGGGDVDSNVQALCRPCHKLKTRLDFDAANTSS